MEERLEAITATIVPTLRVHMANRNLRISELARLAGISSQAVSKAAKGKRVSHYTAQQISDALGIPLHQIVGLDYAEERKNHA